MIEMMIWVRKFFGGTSKDAMSIFDKTLNKLEKVEKSVKAEAKVIDVATTKASNKALKAVVKAEAKYLAAKAKADKLEAKAMGRLNSLAKKGKTELEENKIYINRMKGVMGR